MYVLPIPLKMTVGETFFAVGATALRCDDGRIRAFAAGLDRGGDYAVTFAKEPHPSPEHYTVSVAADGVRVGYSELEGAYRAYTTVAQILAQTEDGKLPQIEIEDRPSIPNRGYMLDISRGKIPKLENLKKLVDLMAALKYNQLQLYLDSFAVAYRNFPEYTADTQPLTLDEIKELRDYCAARFIKMVPNQNSFGHMSVWTAKPELSHLAITGKDGKPSQTLNPLLPETLEFIDRVFDGYVDLFDCEYANVGMDETVDLGMNETKDECDKKGVGRVYVEYLAKVCRLITEKYGKTPMFWDDIVFKHPEELPNVPENAIFMQWGYETEHHYERNCRRISELGRRFYVCPGTSMWGSVTGRSNNALVNITSAAEAGAYNGAEGFLLTEWGDDGHPQFPAVTWLPFAVGAAASWNCMDHDAEVAYGQRTQMLEAVKSYLDDNVYKSKGFADLLYRMGNYYLLEPRLHFNCTYLNYLIRHRDAVTEADKFAYMKIYDHMAVLGRELDAHNADERCKREARLNCDTVMLLCRTVFEEKNAALAADLDALAARYRALWCEENHEKGVEIFIDLLNSFK